MNCRQKEIVGDIRDLPPLISASLCRYRRHLVVTGVIASRHAVGATVLSVYEEEHHFSEELPDLRTSSLFPGLAVLRTAKHKHRL